MDNTGYIIILNFIYWIWSSQLVDSLSFRDLTSMTFINGEGRIFITYLPILLFSVVNIEQRNINLFIRDVKYLSIASLALLAVWLPTHTARLSEGAAGNFVGFFTSHTGAGTFYGLFSVLLIIHGHESRNWKSIMLGGLLVFPLFVSASRAAILAFLVTIIWYMIRLKQWKVFAVTAILVTLLFSSMPLIAPHTWNRTVSLFSMDVIDNMVKTAKYSTWGPGDDESELNLTGKEVNVLMRVTFWTYAIKRFLDSPIIGIGYARYNDHNLKMAGTPGFVYMAVDGTKMLGVGNAHNSYFHILCETGILGLCLFGWFWGTLYFRLKRNIKRFETLLDARALFVACQGIIIFSLVSALIGHSLAAPSLGVPAMTAIGLALAYQRYLDKSLKEQGDLN